MLNAVCARAYWLGVLRVQVPYACIAGIEGYRPPGALPAPPRDDASPTSPLPSARSQSGRRDSAWSHPQLAPASADGDMSGDGDICLSVF